MPTVLQLRFPGRRYHATPWGAHVNEGQLEWPPSPWRLLRALLATGFAKLGWEPQGPPPIARTLFERLAGELPSYVLPPVALAHSRHYVDAANSKPLIFDTWAQVDDGLLEVVWALALPDAERQLFAELAAALGYLGRAESWVEARSADQPQRRPNCLPDRGGPPAPGPDWEAVRVLCPVAPAQYAAWRAEQVAEVEAPLTPPPGRRPSAAERKKLERALAPYPADLLAALCVETGTLQAQGWSRAPGSREVVYWRAGTALAVGVPERRQLARLPAVPLALLALTTEQRGSCSLPPPTRAFSQGRLLHRALASIVGHQCGGDPALALSLLGRETDGRSRQDHCHAHLLHLDLTGCGRLDHVLVHAPLGLDAAAQDALRRLRRTYMKGGAGELQLALAALGDAAALRALPSPLGEALTRTLGPAGGATVWRSATPYVAPRLLKKRGKDSLAGQVRLECQRRGLPEPTQVDVLAADDPAARSFRHHVLHDASHQPPYPMPHALVLTFAEAVGGPLCLGYGAHVGLGRFEAL